MNKYSIEQINVSDSEYKVITLNTNLSNVNKNTLLFSYESSKANYDVYSEISGYVYFNPNIIVGNDYKVGILIAITSANELSDEEVSGLFEDKTNISKEDSLESKENIIITKKARLLIEKHNLDLILFKGHSVISEELVLSKIQNSKFKDAFQDISFYYDKSTFYPLIPKHKKLAIVGAGKAALQVYDAVLAANTHIVVIFYDNNPALENKTLFNCPIKNTLDIDIIKNDYQSGVFDEIVISFSGNIEARRSIFDIFKINEIPIANIIHPSSLISNYTSIGTGNLIFANTRIGPFTKIGDNNVISSLCSLEHHNTLGSHNTFGPSVVFSGSCSIGDENKFGTGIYIEPNVKIGSNSIISSGIVLTLNVPDKKIIRNLNKIEIRDI